jgi:glycosyltransferase involved in cell wall biosynthesis
MMKDLATSTSGSPRNVWRKLGAALELAEQGDFIAAERLLRRVRYDPNLPGEVLSLFRRQIAALAAARGSGRAGPRGLVSTRPGGAPALAVPSDYLLLPPGVVRPPVRRLDPEAAPPSKFPAALTLPPFVGARNDTAFLADAATAWSGLARQRGRIARVHVIHTPASGADAATSSEALVGALGRLERSPVVDPEVAVTIFAPGLDRAPGAEAVPHAPQAPEAAPHLARIAESADLVVFLSGDARPDPELLLRLVPAAEVSDLVVMAFVPTPEGPSSGLITPFSSAALARSFGGRYPYRQLRGLNMAVPAALLRRAGGPEIRFDSHWMAGRELGSRLHDLGAYFLPVALPGLAGCDDRGGESGDEALFEALVSNPWDRKRDGRFEVPKVSVYIPAYNAAGYISRAVDSVLEQDFEDLEVCIAIDGARDTTLEVLEAAYADEPRVRWQAGRNGGIGHASNRAIGMARGAYIGQLDSDDCLKPGAIRRLAGVLDESPDIVCAYGSCERVDAAGDYVKDEYAWPVFSREKMMLTSIVHHFRMFRRQAWERAGHFREDIVNAVDYDIFLKLAETGRVHHVEEILYQRRWHGENTSNVNEGFQTSNTYRVQREALERQGLARYWDVHVPDPEDPRRITYRRRPGTGLVVFWPDYSRSNPYPKLLYAKAAETNEIVSGPIEAALRALETVPKGGRAVFHLHWLNLLFRDVPDAAAAQAVADDFVAKLEAFQTGGGRVVWTVHNAVSHEAPFHAVEMALSRRIAALADRVHLHSAASLPEVQADLALDPAKVRVSRHGSYLGVYPDLINRAGARRQLGLGAEEDVILFAGQVRAYKGFDQLLPAFRAILDARPQARLLIAGEAKLDIEDLVVSALGEARRDRVLRTDRFVDDSELQIFFRAADVAVFPYRAILTSGSLLMSLSFGLPAVVPAVGMTREVLEGRDAGVLYDGAEGAAGVQAALEALLARKDAGTLATAAANARALAEELDWPDFGPVLG